MKFKLCFFALLAIMAASCERNIDIPEPGEHEGEIVTIRASIPPETRVTYTDSNTQGSGGTLAWKTGDKLLLAGYDATGAYVNKSTFTWKGNGDEFEGTPVTGATTYKAYYKVEGLSLDENGNVQLTNEFWEQTQRYGDKTGHLSGKLLLSDTDANALNQTFNLTLQSSIIKFALDYIPKEIGDITKLIWKVETTTGTRSAILDYIDSGVHFGFYRTVTLYLAFDPTVIDIASNGEVKITVIGTGAAYEWSTTVANGKTYDPGKRYTATVNGSWVTIQKPQFRYQVKTPQDNKLYEIWQKDNSSISPTSLTIDWGDGNKSYIKKNATLSKTIASHTYANMGTYTITISSDQLDYSHKQMLQLEFFNQTTAMADTLLTSILDPLLNMGTTDIYGCFAFCKFLTTIPADMFKYNREVSNFNQCFFSCHNLKLRSDIFPDPVTNPDLFAGKWMQFSTCFYEVGTNYTMPQGEAPKLWLFNGGGGITGPTTWPITKCFYNANVTNYSSIPNHWKGL